MSIKKPDLSFHALAHKLALAGKRLPLATFYGWSEEQKTEAAKWASEEKPAKTPRHVDELMKEKDWL